MHAASATAALPNDPDPPPDPATGSALAPSRTGRLLGLLHKLIDFGKDLAHSLQQCTADTVPTAVTRRFGTLNIVLILSRIARGLRLATALEARLAAHPVREATAPAVARAPSDPTPRTTRPVARRASRTPPQLPDVPTAEEIAAALRHRPVGAVIADICRNLGIVPSNPLWDEVMMVVTEFGGDPAKLLMDAAARVCARFPDLNWVPQDRPPAPWSQPAAACGTGPP